MEVKVKFKSITGVACEGSVSRATSFARAFSIAATSLSTGADAFSFVKQDMSNVALYYNGRNIPKSASVESIFPDVSEGTVLMVKKRAPNLAHNKSNSAVEGLKKRKAPKEVPANYPIPAPATESHKDLVYGKTREGEDSLLPGYVSRPNPSPKSRLLEPRNEASPVTVAVSKVDVHSKNASSVGAKRRLNFETGDNSYSASTLSTVGKTCGGSIRPSAAAAATVEVPEQEPSPVVPGVAKLAKLQKPPRKTRTKAPVVAVDWGCNLFAARQSKAAEDAMLQMPLPQCIHEPVKLFSLLSTVVLWLKYRCIQASWVTVREALRQLQGPGSSVTSGHVVQLSQLCPLLLTVGDKQMLHMSWSTRAPSVPDAADVVKTAAMQQRGPDDSCHGSVRNDHRGISLQTATQSTMQSQHCEQHAARSKGASQDCTMSNEAGRSGMASAFGDGGCGGFLVECAPGTAAPEKGTEAPASEGTAENTTPRNGAKVNRSAGSCFSKLQGRPAMDQPEQILEQAADFEIHLEDAPRDVPPAAINNNAGSKPQAAVAKGRRTTRSGSGQLNGSKEAADDAQPAAGEGHNDAAIPVHTEEEPAVMEQGLPAFAAGSHARRHAAAFRRCLVQAVALLQQACIPEGSTEESRKLLMREALQSCYPTHMVLRQPTSATGNTAATAKSSEADLRSRSSSQHPALAFVDQSPLQQENQPTQQLKEYAQNAAACAQALGPEACVNSATGCTNGEKTCQEFAACLCSSAWKESFDVAKVTSEQICEASDVLMSHWESAIEEDGHSAGVCNLHPHRDRPPCLDSTPLSPPQLLEHLQEGTLYEGQIVHTERMAARAAKYGTLEHQLHPCVWVALEVLGIKQGGLFEHQVEAISTLLQGENVSVCTSTASGKSLCYLVPILQALATDSGACALLMFPTKALAQDQRSAIQTLLDAAFPGNSPALDVYDGDAPQSVRPCIRERARLLVTNPDMLHVSILPSHASFERFLCNLRYVVVDESHMYRGAFGCHTAAVLRRLQRVCSREYATLPVFALTSATSADPAAHARALLGVQQVHVVDKDGSPHGPRLFVLWNPPLVKNFGPFGHSRQPRAAGVAKGGGPGRKLRAIEEKRARQEAARAAVRTKNNSRRGSYKKTAQDGEGDDTWRQKAAIDRKRGRASLPDACGRVPEAGCKDETAACITECPAAGQHTEGATGATAQNNPTPCVQPAPHEQDAAAGNGIKAEDIQQVKDTNGNAEQILGLHERDLEVQVQEDVDKETCGADCTIEQRKAIGCFGDVPGPSHQPSSRRERAARMREVEELLAHVGEGGDSGCRSAPLIIGPKPAAGVLDAECLKSIREQLDAASAAAKEQFKAGTKGGRYGAAGVRIDDKRRSPILEIGLLLAECIQHGLRTIAFCKTRKVCELVTSYTREILKETAPTLASRIAVYRSGYSAAERRAIENALHSGLLCGVAATNALELGIDIGRLDVTLHLSFPGSVASMWQQAGRAGRREQTSLSIYVAFDGPLDQHFMRYPSKLFGATVETPQVDPSNLILLQQHVVCAAVELPLVPSLDQQFFGPALHEACTALVANQKLAHTPGEREALHYIGGHTKPSAEVSLRTIDPDRFAIINTATGETLEEIEACNAFFEVYDGAVYMHHGRPFLCIKLDLSGRVALVSPSAVRYYTSPVNHRYVHVVGGHVAYNAGSAKAFEATTARVGQALISLRYSAFVRTARGSQITFDRVDLFLPDVQYMTEAAYVRVPKEARKACEAAGVPYRDSLHAAGHAILNVMPLYMTCNPADICTECENPYAVRYRPERLLVYDRHPGGLGLAARAGPKFTKLLQEALKLVSGCQCTEITGCPGCIQFMRCDAYNTILHKQGAMIVLGITLEHELKGSSSSKDGNSTEPCTIAQRTLQVTS